MVLKTESKYSICPKYGLHYGRSRSCCFQKASMACILSGRMVFFWTTAITPSNCQRFKCPVIDIYVGANPPPGHTHFCFVIVYTCHVGTHRLYSANGTAPVKPKQCGQGYWKGRELRMILHGKYDSCGWFCGRRIVIVPPLFTTCYQFVIRLELRLFIRRKRNKGPRFKNNCECTPETTPSVLHTYHSNFWNLLTLYIQPQYDC